MACGPPVTQEKYGRRGSRPPVELNQNSYEKLFRSGMGQTHHPEADIAIGVLGRGGLAGGDAQVPGAGKKGAALEEA